MSDPARTAYRKQQFQIRCVKRLCIRALIRLNHDGPLPFRQVPLTKYEVCGWEWFEKWWKRFIGTPIY